MIEAQVSDDAGDSTDEESSEYSGLEDEEGSDDEELTDFEDSGDDGGEEEEESGDEDQSDDMSTSEDDENGGSSTKVLAIKARKQPAKEDQPSTSAAAQPVEDEYAYDSSDEEVLYL